MKKQRRARLIRWLGFSIASLASVAAVLVLLVALYLALFDYPEMVRAGLERELSALSGRPARVGSVDVRLPGNVVELRDVAVESEVEGELSLAVERVEGRLSLLAMFRQELHWDELTVEGLSLRLVEQEDGSLAVRVGDDAQPLESSTVSVGADRVSFTDASFIVENERVPWQLEASDLSLAVDRAGFGRYQGRLVYERGRLLIKDHAPLEASVVADFEIVGRELFVQNATARTPFGEMSATGKVGFAGAMRGRFELEGSGEIGPAAETILGVTNASAFASGSATFRGTLSVEPENKIVEGTVLLSRGELGGLSVRDWRGEVFWDRTLIQLSYGTGSLAGGVARVQLHQPLPVRENGASLDLDLESGSLRELVRGLAAFDSPVESSVTARASLRLDTTDPGSWRGEIEARGLDPSSGADASGLLFTLDARWSDGELTIDTGSFETRALAASITGLYPSGGSAQLLVDVSSSDLAAADRLVSEVRTRLVGASLERDAGAAPVPVAPWGFRAGRGRVRGYLSGVAPRLSFDGELTGEAIRYRGVTLDSLRTRAIASSDGLSLEDAVLTRGDGTAAGSGRLGLALALDREGTALARELQLDLSVSRWPAGELLQGLGVVPIADIDGAVSGDLSLGRERARSGLTGVATMRLDDATLAGIPFDRGEARVVLSGSTLEVEPVRLVRGSSELTAALEVDLARRTITGEAATSSLPLEGLGVFGLPLEGRVESRAQIAGSLAAPVVTLAGRGRSLTLGGVPVGEGFVSGAVQDGAARIQVTVERVASNLALDAEVRMSGDYPATGTLTWGDLDIAPWLLDDPGSLRISSTGEAQFRSERGFSEPLASAEVEAALEEVDVEGESFRFASVEPVRIAVREQRLVLEPVDLLQGSSRVSVGGSVDFGAETLDLRADGVVSLGVLESLSRSLRGSGDVELEARLEGNWQRPSLQGFADFDGGSMRLTDFPQALGGLTGRVVFDNQTLRVEELRGVFGSGPVTIRGAAVLDGRQLGSVDLAAEASGVRIRYPEGFVATVDAELSLVGGSEGRVLAGAVRLQDAVWSREYELVAGILSDREETILFEEFQDQDILQELQFDIEVTADESLKLRNSVAEIDASARLSLSGSISEPVLLGSSEAVRGELYFLGQRYDIITGRVDFVDPDSVEPFIDLAAEARVRSYRVELRLIGTPDRFQPELSSDPPLRTVEILRLLAGASDRQLDIRGTEEEELAGVGVASLLTERLTQEVGRRAERLFGLDRFSIDPFLVGQFANPTARMSLGKRITPELFVNYSTNLNATAEAIVLIEYTPEGPMTWVLSRDEEGDVGIDVKFRKSF